jgi:hypothetical protein
VQTRAEITKLQQSLGTTSVCVTHDQVEAMTMGHLFDSERIDVRLRNRLGSVEQRTETLPPAHELGARLAIAQLVLHARMRPRSVRAVDFYAGGIPGVGTYAGRTTALYSSESAINTLCSGGTMHRFSAQLPSWTQGQLIYPYGLDATWRGYYLLPPSTGCVGGYCSW